ncbi:MAG TPA: hydrogenase formation protein HypD [Archaeoglobus profundus]|nr:hydrogenase formation protein HypD [Archaeoglobus profundus]
MNRKTTILNLAKKIKEEMEEFREVKIMHLCGTHEDTVTRYNLRSILPNNLKLISGPGCPVCITPDTDLQKIFHLIEKKKDVIIATFGDMARVPFEGKSLFYYKSKGYDVRIIYSVFDAVKLAKESNKPVVFFAIGFETTMPSTALAILDGVENFYVFSAHRFFVPAMEYLISLGVKIDGFINPGHVSTIVGVKAYEHIKVPQVIAGFEPEDVMLAIYMLIKAIKEGKVGVLNEYTRAVKYEGNLKAQEVMNEVFNREDWEWRGLGVVPKSGGAIKKKYEDYDALKIFEDVFDDFTPREDVRKKKCRCGDVLRGLIEPKDCPLFMKACTPKTPIGPCMVSFEGACNIWARFGKFY